MTYIKGIKVLSAIALIGSIGWVITDPGFEPGLAVIGSFSALISAFLVGKRKAKRAQQNQSISESSIGVQAGRDISIGNIGYHKDAVYQEAYKHFTNQLSYAIGRYNGYSKNLAPGKEKYSEIGVMERINEVKSARLQLLSVCGENVRSLLLEEGTEWLNDIQSFGKRAPSIMEKLAATEFKDRT